MFEKRIEALKSFVMSFLLTGGPKQTHSGNFRLFVAWLLWPQTKGSLRISISRERLTLEREIINSVDRGGGSPWMVRSISIAAGSDDR
ncbi:hypothetical protein CDAR_192131 [Caerostris darwini]|uniref:Uncharacterized protein n=1 Tax=Caerostris darwini TaxID=1538125 RepID=A0AAV4PGT4_9ARAC|nr:hypothetical protein CDAR_192131 [Caerostris darwini]